MKRRIFFLLLLYISCKLYSNDITGVVVNAQTKEKIGYVRIAFENNIFNLSDSLGIFSLNLSNYEGRIDQESQLTFDRPGFITISMSLGDFEKTNRVVPMNPVPMKQAVKNVSFDPPSSGKKTMEGNTRGSSTYIFKLDFMKEPGGEFGIVIGKKVPSFVSSLNLYIGHSKIRHLKFRVNLYDLNNDFMRINSHEIIVHADLGKAYRAVHDWVSFNISDHRLIIDREVLIVFENICHQNISEDIELSFSGFSISPRTFYMRLHPFREFIQGPRISMYAETIPIL